MTHFSRTNPESTLQRNQQNFHRNATPSKRAIVLVLLIVVVAVATSLLLWWIRDNLHSLVK